MTHAPLRIVSIGSERLPELRELWHALEDHHSRLPASLARGRARARAASWRRRRTVYEHYLAGEQGFCLLADEGEMGPALGYAMVWLGTGLQVGAASTPVAYLASLSVAPLMRGQGVGGALLGAVEDRAHAYGARRLLVGVREDNLAARRFYLGRGLSASGPGTLAKALGAADGPDARGGGAPASVSPQGRPAAVTPGPTCCGGPSLPESASAVPISQAPVGGAPR